MLTLALAGGCAFENKRLTCFDPAAGYRLPNFHPDTTNTDAIFVVLAFSGGGTRAAAFSFGAMRQLSLTPINDGGPQRTLLDEVDVISSVSGGSFTAAYYALRRERLLTSFPKDFLLKNVELGLALRVLNPFNWPRLASSRFDRIDLAADYYDSLLFKGATYQDLIASGRRPYIVINATDMSKEAQFEFVQDQFDLLYSDLGSYPLARAVAASSAFPVLLSPLTLKNHSPGGDFQEPQWITDAMGAKDHHTMTYNSAELARSYEDPVGRPFIHLLDGGLSDNAGLGGPTRALLSTDRTDSILSLINLGRIKRLVFITVNAKPGVSVQPDRSRTAPGLLGVLSTTTSGPMDNSSLQSSILLKQNVEDFNDRQKALAKMGAPSVDYYDIELRFDDVKCPEQRRRLKSLPTNYHLDPKDIQLLEDSAATLLKESSEFIRLTKTLSRPPQSPAAGASANPSK